MNAKKLSREFDARIAEELLGCTVQWALHGDAVFCGCPSNQHRAANGPLKNYSEEIAAAWEVVEKMNSEGWLLGLRVKVTRKDSGDNVAQFSREGVEGPAFAGTVPRAICDAALAAAAKQS